MDHESLLREKFAALVGWEKTRRRERIIVAALFWSLVLSLPVLLARRLWAVWFDPLFVPLGLFFLASAAVLRLRRWSGKDSLKSVFLLDRTLAMEDRGLTAWEILARAEKNPAERLVLDEAAGYLRAFDPKVTFQKPFSWYGVAALIVAGVWIAGARLSLDSRFAPKTNEPATVSSARSLKEFLEPVKEKAEIQGLSQSVETARALQQVAEKQLQNEVNEELFRAELAQAMTRLDTTRPAELGKLEGALLPISRANLEGLGAEIEELKRQLKLMEARADKMQPGAGIAEKLAQLPRLERALEQSRALEGQRGEKEMDAAELQNLLDQLEAEVKSELERLTQAEIQEFLASVLASLTGEGREKFAGKDQGTEKGSAAGAQKDRATGTLPGKEQGGKGEGMRDIAPLASARASQLKGAVNEGERTSLKVLGANHSIGASKEKEKELLAQYRREVERDLATEEIPDGLKDAIKKYFLSLGGDKGSP